MHIGRPLTLLLMGGLLHVSGAVAQSSKQTARSWMPWSKTRFNSLRLQRVSKPWPRVSPCRLRLR